MATVSKMKLSIILLSSVGMLACGANQYEDLATISQELTVTKDVLYEGSCAFLLRCSAPSKAAGRVLFGCESLVPSLKTTTCSDSFQYLAAPNKDYCGLPIKICTSGGRCTEAEAWDTSNIAAWEANPAVMNALGQSYYEPTTSCAGASGTIRGAQVSFGTWGSWYDSTLTAGATKEIFFSPGKRGWHAIDFANNAAVYGGGDIQLCWKSATTTWSCWKTVRVSNGIQREKLWSGSSDISYKFIITALKNTGFHWRFYLGW